ncbi:MAG: aminomethyl-transferring glycine dehydrogenase subunit GcvPA [Fimbriimonadaceae bacterium]|nr:aminomethyl-transferring glycine dehydrogenase subunit GcvPA [Fimbriimonadaceae bacterium]QYK54810.1 MAG: aminomethyl-transferring glycine dehydrogenase subunit GcvPA [Fimbriimonadaceae bacterium]
MLETIGVESIDDLFVEIPESLRLRRELDVPPAMDERQLFQHLKGLADRNLDATKLVCFLGAGIYDRFVPASVAAVVSRGEFLTAYTPYQPELSQGYLQTIYEFQTMVADLFGMDLANASMYDGATALAEAAIMATGIKGRDVVAVSQAVHPHYRQVLETYCWSLGVSIRELPCTGGETVDFSAVDDSVACVLVQYPNFFGIVEDLGKARDAARSAGAMFIVSADPTACGILTPPGAFDADVVTAEGQPLGVPMGYGGPLLGLFACKQEFIRQIPGRIVGRTHDAQGRSGYTMTLRTREQDIRREKATSNICTNEALMALAATVYMSAVGKNGIRRVAESSVRNTQYAIQRLTEAGGKLKYPGRVFGEFVLSLPRPAAEVRDALIEKGYLAGLPLSEYYQTMENDLLVAVTEVRTKAQIDGFAAALKEAL